MPEIETDQLREAVENMHGGKATLVQSVPVKETFMGGIVWEGVVHVFQLAGNLKANLAYAWSSPIEGSTKRRFFAVLRIPPITSPVEAVRAAIVQEHRATQGEKKMTSAPKPRKSLGFVVCTDAAGNEKSRIDYFNEEHAQALERDCTRRGGNPNRSQVQ